MSEETNEKRNLLDAHENTRESEHAARNLLPLSVSYKLLRLFVQFLMWCMITQATLMLVVSILLYFLYLNTTALWVLFIVLGFVSGPCIASGFGVVNHYIEMTSVAQMVPQKGAAVADFIVMFAVGYSFDHYGPYSIWAHLLVICIIIFIVSTMMLILGYFHSDRYSIEETKPIKETK